jgi:hypothetical protein
MKTREHLEHQICELVGLVAYLLDGKSGPIQVFAALNEILNGRDRGELHAELVITDALERLRRSVMSEQ